MAPYLPPYRRACRLDRSARTMSSTKLDIDLQRIIAAWLERSGMSAERLGELAPEDAGFVAELNRGRSPRLDAVDRLLGFMGIAPIGPRFRQEVEAFLIVIRTRPSALGAKAVGKSSFVRELRSGTSPTLESAYRARTWMHGFADELDRTAIAWLLANDAPTPPYGLCAVFAPWTDDDRDVGKLDESTLSYRARDRGAPRPFTSNTRRLSGHRRWTGVSQVRAPGVVRALRRRGVGEGEAPTESFERRVMAPGSNQDRVASARAGAKSLGHSTQSHFPLGHRRDRLNSRRSVPP